jgi:hypothetical protein|tara:strand:+ start:57 stop:404 length:348 start_codon:yes stop_codon:yes gene_type:complete
MKIQLPAEGVLKRNDWGDSISYQVVCQCHYADHDHSVWVEADNCDVTVTTYTTQQSKPWSLNRWQVIWCLLTKGYVEYEANIIMTEQQALNYATVLTQAVKDVKLFKSKKVNYES